jgi:1H-pyrrole-2-carbonyl-[peptidyl-carrier protein] brominase
MQTDVVIVGAGPAGSACALFLQQKGISATLIEKEEFPRQHVGESLTGECRNLFKKLGLEEEIASKGFMVKHGGRVFGPNGKTSFLVPLMARSQEKGQYPASAWQVRRDELDKVLLDAAKARGVQVIHGQALRPQPATDGSIHDLQIKSITGESIDIEARVLVDASGQATFLSNSGILSKKERGHYDKQVAFWGHVRGVIQEPGEESGNTLIFYRQRNHWAWFIPVDKETVSIGIIVPMDYFKQKKENPEAFFQREMNEINPSLSWRVRDSQLVGEVRAVSNYSYEIKHFTGNAYLCVGDAHRFIDPVISFGVHVALHEALKAAESIEEYLQGKLSGEEPFLAYQEYCERGTDVFQQIIDGFWEHPLAFAFLVHERYVEDFRDMFAGRVYGQSYAALEALRLLNAPKKQRVAIHA